MTTTKKTLIIALAIGLFFSYTLYAEDATVTATLEPTSVQVGQQATMSIQVSGQTQNVQTPRPPSLSDIDIFYSGRSSRISMVNGVTAASLNFIYVLVPKREGDISVPPFDVSVDNKIIKTPEFNLKVRGVKAMPQAANPNPYANTPAANTAPSLQSVSLGAGEDNNVFARVWTDKKTLYQNEQLLLIYSLYTRYDTRYEGFDKEAETSGFWIEEFPIGPDVPRETTTVNGKRYVKADVRKMALFPTAPGNYTIQPGSLKVSVLEEKRDSKSLFDEFFSDNFFNGNPMFSRRQNRSLNMPAIQLEVLPLPEVARPASFQGAVGQFKLTAAIDHARVKQNEPVTLKITIEGEGNIETLSRPKVPELTGFKTYDADTNSKLFQNANVVGGSKTFEVVFIPKNEGQSFIPPLEFSYFDPRLAKYKVLQTPNFPITVEKNDVTFQLPDSVENVSLFQKKVRSETKDIRFIDEKITSLKWLRVVDLSFLILLWVDIFLVLVFLVLWNRSRREKVFSKDVALKRRKTARLTADANIKNLKNLASKSNAESLTKFFVEVERSLTQYLTDKWNLSVYGVTRQELEDILTRHFDADDAHLKEVLELFRLCDESRFGKCSLPQSSKKIALRIFQETVNKIERMR